MVLCYNATSDINRKKKIGHRRESVCDAFAGFRETWSYNIYVIMQRVISEKDRIKSRLGAYLPVEDIAVVFQ